MQFKWKWLWNMMVFPLVLRFTEYHLCRLCRTFVPSMAQITKRLWYVFPVRVFHLLVQYFENLSKNSNLNLARILMEISLHAPNLCRSKSRYRTKDSFSSDSTSSSSRTPFIPGSQVNPSNHWALPRNFDLVLIQLYSVSSLPSSLELISNDNHAIIHFANLLGCNVFQFGRYVRIVEHRTRPPVLLVVRNRVCLYSSSALVWYFLQPSRYSSNSAQRRVPNTKWRGYRRTSSPTSLHTFSRSSHENSASNLLYRSLTRMLSPALVYVHHRRCAQ